MPIRSKFRIAVRRKSWNHASAFSVVIGFPFFGPRLYRTISPFALRNGLSVNGSPAFRQAVVQALSKRPTGRISSFRSFRIRICGSDDLGATVPTDLTNYSHRFELFETGRRIAPQFLNGFSVRGHSLRFDIGKPHAFELGFPFENA